MPDSEAATVKDAAVKFLQDKMKIHQKIEIKTAYRLNDFKVVFHLQDPNDTKTIFEHAKNLKGLKKQQRKILQN